MISDEERREVARKLRELAAANESLLGKERMKHVLGDGQRILGTVGLASVADVLRRHADLIDRPTCSNVYDGREFECSECGMQWYLLDRADVFEQWAHVRTPRYCPECGAEVVS